MSSKFSSSVKPPLIDLIAHTLTDYEKVSEIYQIVARGYETLSESFSKPREAQE